MFHTTRALKIGLKMSYFKWDYARLSGVTVKRKIVTSKVTHIMNESFSENEWDKTCTMYSLHC